MMICPKATINIKYSPEVTSFVHLMAWYIITFQLSPIKIANIEKTEFQRLSKLSHVNSEFDKTLPRDVYMKTIESDVSENESEIS